MRRGYQDLEPQPLSQEFLDLFYQYRCFKLALLGVIFFGCISLLLGIALTSVSVYAFAFRPSFENIIPDYSNRGKYTNFLLSADIHYDPFYLEWMSCKSLCRGVVTNWTRSLCDSKIVLENATHVAPHGRLACNAPKTLVDSIMDAMKRVEQKPDFILSLGDHAAHGIVDVVNVNTTGQVINAIRVVSEKFMETFPDSPVFPVLGNADVPNQNYIMPTGSVGQDWLRKIWDQWEPLVTCRNCSNTVKQQLEVDVSEFVSSGIGYYSVNKIPNTPGVRILALNTLLYTSNDHSGDASRQKLGENQLIWLDTQLHKASEAGDKVIIIGHIPPGIQPRDQAPQWKDNWAVRIVSIFEKYSDVIISQFYGHFHFETFKLYISNSGEKLVSSAIIAPSGTPFFSNNPGFLNAFLDKEKKRLLDYNNYYLDLQHLESSEWRLSYNFRTAYQLDDITTESLQKLHEKMHTEQPSNTLSNFLLRSGGNVIVNREKFECAMKYQRKNDMQECVKKNAYIDTHINLLEVNIL